MKYNWTIFILFTIMLGTWSSFIPLVMLMLMFSNLKIFTILLIIDMVVGIISTTLLCEIISKDDTDNY